MVTEDGKLCAHFEHMVAVQSRGTKCLLEYSGYVRVRRFLLYAERCKLGYMAKEEKILVEGKILKLFPMLCSGLRSKAGTRFLPIYAAK